MFALLIFLAVLVVLVISHEFGHFIIARINGIKVEEFGFGFPPKLFSVRSPKTTYSFNLIPLGGFVKIKGEDGSDANDADSFANKKAWQKSLVIVAGVVMNVIVAAILLSVGFMVGMPQIGDGEGGPALSDAKLEIFEVLPGKPAEAAGLKPGDIIEKVGELSKPALKQFQEYVNTHRDETIAVAIKRDGETISKNIHPIIYADTGKGGLGVAVAEVGLVRYPWYSAIYHGVIATGVYLKEILLSFFFLIWGLIRGAGVDGAVSGPVGVATMTGQVARMGISYLIQFTALLSLNLAVLNILPIPALDGGRLFFIVIGKIFRRPVSPDIERVVHTVGFVLLIVLVLLVTARDLGSNGIFMDWWKKII